MFYYNPHIRLTLPQINLKYYVICKSRHPANRMSKPYDAAYMLSKLAMSALQHC